MKKIITLLLLAASMQFHCSNKKQIAEHATKVEVVHLDPSRATEVNLSAFVQSVEYIKLQSDSSCVMGRLKEILIRDKFIYAIDLSQMAIFVFDKKGNYISKLDKRGNGPGEYNFMGPVFIDANEKYIEIIDDRGVDSKILKYSNISFDFLGEKEIHKVRANAAKRMEDFYYFSTQQLDNHINGERTNGDIIVVHQDSTKILFDKKIDTHGSYYSFYTEAFMMNDKNDLYASLMFDHTFYKLEGFDAISFLTVDFGEYAVDNAIGLKSTAEQLEYLREVKGAYFPVLNINNKDMLSFSYYFRDKLGDISINQYIRLGTGAVFHSNKIKNDITGFPENIFFSINNAVNHEVWHKDYLVDIVLPSDYLPHKIPKEIEGLGEVSIDDNPIIVLMKLKK